MTRAQSLVPGIIGFAPATDYVYLREIQSAAKKGVGLVNSLRTLYATLDTDTFFGLDDAGRTGEAGRLVSTAAESLRNGGADFLVVTSNTGSIILEEAGDVGIPLLSIFDAVMAEVIGAGFRRPGLLSTRRTVESGRYHSAAERLGATVLAPRDSVVTQIDTMIDSEAIRGITTPASLTLLQTTVKELADAGADSVILGCTDLALFGLENVGAGVLPIVDSTVAHARAAASRAVLVRS